MAGALAVAADDDHDVYAAQQPPRPVAVRRNNYTTPPLLPYCLIWMLPIIHLLKRSLTIIGANGAYMHRDLQPVNGLAVSPIGEI